jgi:hypothetical protein
MAVAGTCRNEEDAPSHIQKEMLACDKGGEEEDVY